MVFDCLLREEQWECVSPAGSALCLGSILTVSFIALSTPIALHFRETAVATVVVVLNLTLLNDSIQVLPRALLQRDLKFRTLAWLHGLQVTIAAVLMASCAALSLGYWALVLNKLLSGGAITVVLYGLRPFQVAWSRQFGTIAGSRVAG